MSLQSTPATARVPTSDLPAASTPGVTVVVPTRNERDNISLLIDRLERVCPETGITILFVDDSADDTPQVIGERARRSSRPVGVIHRPEDQRDGGLGGAVCVGFGKARSEWICVMDADLQHSPELLPALIEEAARSKADVVVASRYCATGDLGDLSAIRRALSRGSALLARMLFPRRLWGVSDPMSGFFLVRRAAIDVSALRPRGFKIMLEILLCGRRLTTSELGFCFGQRHAGDSKATLREGARYVRRLIELRVGERTVRLAAFGTVGAIGVVVNTGVLEFLVGMLHVWYLAASVVATQVAILFNYALAERLVFCNVEAGRTQRCRLATYIVFNNASLALTAPLLVLFVSVVGVGLAAANVLSLLVLGVVRFAVADVYMWGPAPIPGALRRSSRTRNLRRPVV